MSDTKDLENQVRHVIDSAIETTDVRVIDLVGMLENIKFDLLCQAHDVKKEKPKKMDVDICGNCKKEFRDCQC